MSNNVIEFPNIQKKKPREKATSNKLLELDYYLVFMRDGILFHSVGYSEIPTVGEYVMIFQDVEDILGLTLEEFAKIEVLLMHSEGFVHFLESNDIPIDELSIEDIEPVDE